MIALEILQFLWTVTRQNQKQNNKITIIFGGKTFSDYSRTSRKRPPKNANTQWSIMGGGHLQELNHRGPLSRRGPGTSNLWKILNCMQFLSYAMCSSLLLQKFFVYISRQHSAHSERRDQRMHRVVVNSRLKTMENP